MGNFIPARQFKGNWTANSINLNSETATRLLWVTDSWEQSCQLGRDTKFNATSTPIHTSPQKPAHLKGITRMLQLTEEGDVSNAWKNPSAGRACSRQLLLTQPHMPRAPQQKSTSHSNLLFLTQSPKHCPVPEFLVWVRIWKGGLGGFPGVNFSIYDHL